MNTPNPHRAPLVFLDIETCGLALTDPVWEVAAIRRNPHGSTQQWHFLVEHDADAAAALPPKYRADHDRRYNPAAAYSLDQAAKELAYMFLPDGGYRAHLVGCCPWFDAARLSAQMLNGAEPWHHHLVDVEAMAVGWLSAHGRTIPTPWAADALWTALGVNPDPGARHTAMYDTHLAMAVYDAVTGGWAR